MGAHSLLDQAHVIVVGSGGNIGSHLVPHLARTPAIRRITLIDPDVYEERNLRNQAITRSALLHSKVQVQARSLRRMNPSLQITALAHRVEDVPLGRLRGDLILCCVDSRRSRQFVNEAAWRIGVPWLDAGVLADGLLARLELFVPNPELACLECKWTDADFAALEQTYPCRVGPATAPTAASSGLGALAATMQALACEQRLANDESSWSLSGGEQVVIDAMHHRLLRTTHRRNPQCRFDHDQLIDIRPITTGVRTVGALVERVGEELSTSSFVMNVAGLEFIRRLRCARCGAARPTFRLSRSTASAMMCRVCRAPMVAAGFDRFDHIDTAELSHADKRCSLRAAGLRDGDVITAESETQVRHLELHRPPRRGHDMIFAHMAQGG